MNSTCSAARLTARAAQGALERLERQACSREADVLRACLQVRPLLRPDSALECIDHLWVAYEKACCCRGEAARSHMQRPTGGHAPAASLRPTTPLASAPPHTPAPAAASPTAQRRGALQQMQRPSWELMPCAMRLDALQWCSKGYQSYLGCPARPVTGRPMARPTLRMRPRNAQTRRWAQTWTLQPGQHRWAATGRRAWRRCRRRRRGAPARP